MLGYDDTGAGEPLVLLHGLATTRGIWRHVVPLLEHRRVVAVDVPGFGASPAAGRGFELGVVARGVLDGLPFDGPFDLLGHSMGGAVALTLAAQAPERVRRLILCSPAGLRPIPQPAARAFGAVGETLIHLRRVGAPLAAHPWGRRLLLATGTADGAAFSTRDVQAMVTASRGAKRISSALTSVASADLRPLLGQAPPALGLLWGAEDRIIPAELIEAIQAQRPDAVAAIVPDAGHIAMMERPHAFVTALEHLLGDPPGVHR